MYCHECAACGRKCCLNGRVNHTWHICSRPDCVFCHERNWTNFVHVPGDAMDRATTALAVVGLVGLFVAGWG